MRKNVQRSLYAAAPFVMFASVVASTAATTAQAADRPARVVIAQGQVRVMGIETMPLQTQANTVSASFPAQVSIPATAEQVVSSPVAGLVAQLLAEQNQPVRRGAPLVRIVSPELGQLQLQLLQTTARATLARQTARREQQLFDDGIIPQRRVQESQAALKEADAALNNAKAALRMSGMAADTIERVAASGQAHDSITLAATQSGIVTEIAIKPGQRVEAAAALVRIAQTGTLWLDIQLPASESSAWPVGTRVKVRGMEITARVASGSAGVSSASQTMVLRAVIEGQTGQLRPGEFVTVELPAGAAREGWDVPLAAVSHDGAQAYVFVRTADGFEARPVKLTASAGQRVRVQGALKTGEHVAISGVIALKGAWLDGKVSK